MLKREELRLDAETRARVDRTTSALARRFTAQVERALAAIAEDLPEDPDPGFLETLEGVVEGLKPSRANPGSVDEVGALLLLRASAE